jgi:hypothetical protein
MMVRHHFTKVHEEKRRTGIVDIRDAIIEGYEDVIAGRLIPYSGDLKADMKKFARIANRQKLDTKRPKRPKRR